MRHEAGARTEDREVEAALAHEPQLIALDRFAQLVVADAQLGWLRHLRGIRDAGDLAVAPRFQRLRRGGVVAVDVDDHRVTPARTPCFACRMRIWEAVTAGLGCR